MIEKPKKIKDYVDYKCPDLTYTNLKVNQAIDQYEAYHQAVLREIEEYIEANKTAQEEISKMTDVLSEYYKGQNDLANGVLEILNKYKEK